MNRCPAPLLVLLLVAASLLFACADAPPAPSASPRPASAAAEGASGGLTEDIHRAALKWFDDYLAGGKLDELAPLAEKIVDRLAAGGHFYVAGDPGFCDEMNFRAGGFSGVRVWAEQKLENHDVLLIGLLDQNSKTARYLAPSWIGQNRGNMTPALTIHVGSAQWPQIAKIHQIAIPAQWPAGLYVLDTAAPPTASMKTLALSQMAGVVVTYALEGEMIAAASRKGLTLAMLASIGAAGGDDFDAKIRGQNLLDAPKLAPIPAGKLAREYLTLCRRQVAAYLNDADRAACSRAAARRIVDCQNRGGTILTICSGHIHARGDVVPPELPRLVVYGSSWQWETGQGLQAGDTLFFIGYAGFPDKAVKSALDQHADAVAICLDEGPKDDRVTTVRSTWERWDGVVEVPGYPYKELPTSGVVQTLQWYSIMAEAQALVKAGGK